MSDSNDKVIATATSFKFDCNLCGKGGHKAKDCPQCDKIKCEYCGQLGHKKAICWKLEANKSKRPEWWMEAVAVSVDDGKIILRQIVQIQTLKWFCKLYCCTVVSAQKVVSKLP
jgi:hypothetical protein